MVHEVAVAIRELCGVTEEAPYATFVGSRESLVDKLLVRGFDERAINSTLRQLADADALRLHASYFKWNESNWRAYCSKVSPLTAA